MAKNDLWLLGAWFSPFALRVQIALNLKGLDYEVVEETLNPKSELLLKSNPVHKKIPVFFHGDKVICESAIIVEYIDESWSSGIRPCGMLYWLKQLIKMMRQRSHTLWEWKKHLRGWKKCSTSAVKERPTLGGDTIGIIDIAFGSLWSWMRVIEEMNERKVFDEAKNPAFFFILGDSVS
ncbi:Glutathione S-transferase U17 [Glycine soja]|uniref:Glutathione S-transferase n=1 Tax=Glycine soja TaxID=3848 RepID=A0A0B2R971_GLYSO|nr:Glutathione S-transferase U17 [Glycine soja]